MGHRYYDPTLGRFTQPDPSGQEQNAYLYAASDPIVDGQVFPQVGRFERHVIPHPEFS
ncbi:RHS repeat-associated core domain-containing protein [Streptomyces parvulus]|uniref:RHS repeat-associated core domain-containing protein n=1 Tax=Streptomyces parvulus TaxID=146923 RepID=UPI0037AB821F